MLLYIVLTFVIRASVLGVILFFSSSRFKGLVGGGVKGECFVGFVVVDVFVGGGRGEKGLGFFFGENVGKRGLRWKR